MARLDKDDLAQMNKHYFQSLEKQRLVEVATNLHQLAVEQWERLEQNSRNSSRPPSTDNPYQTETTNKEDCSPMSELSEEQQIESSQEKELSSEEAQPTQNQELADSGPEKSKNQGEKRNPGKQPGAEGKWRSQPLVASQMIPHYPEQCASCNQKLSVNNHKPYMGYYVLELNLEKSGFQVVCQLHHYYELGCECGHQTNLDQVKVISPA